MNFPSLIYLVDPNDNVSLPANEGDVGCDVIADSDPVIVGVKDDDSRDGYKCIDYIEYDLNIRLDGFQPEDSQNDDVYTLVFPRSSLSKYNLVLANSIGLIDSGYRGTLKVRFKYVFQPEDFRINAYGSFYALVDYDKIYKKGDKICQLVFQKHFHPQFGYGENVKESQRGEGGFGSSTPNQ